MRKPTFAFLVATVAVAAAFCGQAAMAVTFPLGVYGAQCPPGFTWEPSPPGPMCTVGNPQLRTGECSMLCMPPAKAAASLYTAWFNLYSSHSITPRDEYPVHWINSVSSWSDGGSWSQVFNVYFDTSVTGNLICTASAQPGGADYVGAAVVDNRGTSVEVREFWTSQPDGWYNQPVTLTCRPTA